jgi:hypothetical protein
MTARRTSAGLMLALIGLALPACAAPASGTVSAAAPTSVPPPAGVRWPAAGALFGGPPDRLGAHYCSAAVVDAPSGDLVITAAHCVADGDGSPPQTGMSFVPGYHDHVAPFGVWTVTAAAVDDSWRDHADPDHDVAFLHVARDGAPPVETVTGGYHLQLNPDPVTPVDAIGYPDFADAPTERTGTTSSFSPTQLRLDAPGLYDGTSGGPWLRTAGGGAAGPGVSTVIAVTGGYEQGGLDPDTSYATYLGAAAAALFRQAGGIA